MLRPRYRVIVQTEWDGTRADVMIALHAHRSAASIARYAERGGPLAVVLSGTDLYRDLPGSQAARRSLDLAHRIVTLQSEARRSLEPRWREKAEVIYQSARSLRPRRKAPGRLDCIAVGHLRAEKDPATLLAAMRELPSGLAIRVRHVGAPLDASLADAARRTEREDSRYRYSGPLPHGLARAAIAASHLLVHPSVMEGGANVIVEAVTAGTPVLASRIPGNIGMLGPDYPGYFATGDASDLARRLVQLLDGKHYRSLVAACRERKPLFAPAAEARAIDALVAGLAS